MNINQSKFVKNSTNYILLGDNPYKSSVGINNRESAIPISVEHFYYRLKFHLRRESDYIPCHVFFDRISDVVTLQSNNNVFYTYYPFELIVTVGNGNTGDLANPHQLFRLPHCSILGQCYNTLYHYVLSRDICE